MPLFRSPLAALASCLLYPLLPLYLPLLSPYLCLSLYGFSSCRSAFAAAALSVSSHSKQAEPSPAGGRAFTRRRHGSPPAACPSRFLIACRSSMHVEQSGLTAKFSGAVNGSAGRHMDCAARPPLQRLVRRGLGYRPLLLHT